MSLLSIIGTGPGDPDYLIPAARNAVRASTDLVGYDLYLDLLGSLSDGKTQHRLPLGQEVRRARVALDLAAAGHPTALISSGDPGIYAMAAVVYELLDTEARWPGIQIQTLPGISAIQLLAARVGAPLGHDFCTISLSDLLTPRSTILKRIQAAADGDFIIGFYNPASRRRQTLLPAARELLLQQRPGGTPVLIGRQLGRPDEHITITDLQRLDPAQVDMRSLVLIGNRETLVGDGFVYTPRGYAAKTTASLNEQTGARP